jgi:hypothetical protein
MAFIRDRVLPIYHIFNSADVRLHALQSMDAKRVGVELVLMRLQQISAILIKQLDSIQPDVIEVAMR